MFFIGMTTGTVDMLIVWTMLLGIARVIFRNYRNSSCKQKNKTQGYNNHHSFHMKPPAAFVFFAAAEFICNCSNHRIASSKLRYYLSASNKGKDIRESKNICYQ